jgi:hypothetical protein
MSLLAADPTRLPNSCVVVHLGAALCMSSLRAAPRISSPGSDPVDEVSWRPPGGDLVHELTW